jgi:LmbE family N-acetylglucosaminyl deacetylase
MSSYKISCLIPAYNEEGRVGNVVKTVKSCPLVSEVIVVSDGSIDNTAKEAKLAGSDKVIELEKNIGKGGAVFRGAEEASYPILLLLDADLINLNIYHIQKLIETFINKEADMVIGVLKDDFGQKILPLISGQRIVRKDFILRFPEIKKSRFNLEILMNKFAKKLKYKVVFVDLENLDHFKKEEKYKNEIYFKKKIESFFSWTSYIFKKIKVFLFIGILIFLLFKPYKISLSNLKLMPSPGENDRVMVIVAHPDDEVIGAGGYLAQAVKNKSKVLVVILTNGEGNKFSAYFVKHYDNDKSLKNIFIKEGKVRREESLMALKHIGVEKNNVIFLDFPDRYLMKLLTTNWSDPLFYPYSFTNKPYYVNYYNYDKFYKGEDMLKALEEIFQIFKPNILITHSLYDYHPDHKATFLFVNLLIKNNLDIKPQVYTFLVHFNNFYKILNISTSNFSTSKEKIKNLDFYFFPLSSDILNLKKEAVKEYKNQLKSLYLDYVFKVHLKDREIFVKENL